MSLKCKLITNFDFNFNHNMINFVYQPIVGKQAINLYKDLISYLNLQQQLGNNLHLNLNDICNYLNLSEKEFFEQMKLLEAMKLIEKFIEQYKQEEMIIKINSSIQWNEFVNEPKYFNLLQSKIDLLELERLKNLFSNNQLIGFINASSTFEEIFKIDYDNFQLNFEFFYNYLFQKTKELIPLTEQNKIILDNAYSKYHFNYEQLSNFIANAIIRNEANEIIVDNQLLTLNIKQKVDQGNIKNFNLNLKINRNNQIFLKNANLDEFKYVIDDYKTLNAEHYLACIQKHELNHQDLMMINNLRKEFHLPDFVINILIDFCIYKNKGRIEANYLNKIALTINRLNLKNIEAILKHLSHSQHEHQRFNQISSQKINW